MPGPISERGLAFNKQISAIAGAEIDKLETGAADALTLPELLAPFSAAVAAIIARQPREDRFALAEVTKALLDIALLLAPPSNDTAPGVH